MASVQTRKSLRVPETSTRSRASLAWWVFGRRLVQLLVSLLVASLLIFLALNALPGDAAAAIAGVNADPAEIAAIRAKLGLDRPVLLRYLSWLHGLVTGDLGHSVISGDSVTSLIAPRFGVTLSLVLIGMTLSLLIALPLGMFAAVHRRRFRGAAVAALSQLGMAVPAFLAAIVLILVFGVELQWLPAGGYVDIQRNPGEWFRHLILPSVSLALVNGSLLARYVRASFIDVLHEDWFRTSRAVGWTTWRALFRHGLRNAALSIVTVFGLQVATVFVGAIVIEQVFALPGVGTLLLDEVNKRDLVVVQSLVMILVALVLVINTLTDVLYAALDPRLRVGVGSLSGEDNR